MKVIRRYIFKELLVPFGLSLVAFTFVVLMNKIIRLTELIVNKGVNLWTAVTLFSYILPAFLVLAIPCTVLLASQVAIGRLSADNEATALLSSGLSFYQFLSPVMFLSVLAFLLTLVIMIFVTPHANSSFSKLFNQIGHEIVQSSSALDFKERVFHDELTDMVVYINKIPPSGDVLKGVLISNYRRGAEPQVITAKEGKIISHPDSLKITVRLVNGSIHNRIEGDRYRKIDFGTYELQLDLGKLMPKSDKDKREREMTIAELRQMIKKKQAIGEPTDSYKVELQKKFAIPFACLLLGMVGAPLGMSYTRRSTRSAGFILSIGIVFIYYIILCTGESLGYAGKIPAYVAMWLPNFLLLITAVYLVRKVANQSPIKLMEYLNVLGDTLSIGLAKLKEKLGL